MFNTDQAYDFLFLDLETTGTDPKVHSIIEVACFTLSPNKWIYEAVVNPEPNVVWEPMVIEMHQKSGLSRKIELGQGRPLSVIDEELYSSLKQNQKRYALAGNSVQFDLAFVKEHMPKLSSLLHHRILDVSSVRQAMRDVDPAGAEKVADDLGPKPHNALEDCYRALYEYEMYVKLLKKEP